MAAPAPRFTWVLLLLSGLLTFSLSGAKPAVTPGPEPAATQSEITLPPQGLYDSCWIEQDECLHHLDELAAKGFQLILNYGQLYGDAASQIKYADRAQALGMKIIWSINYSADWQQADLLEKYADLAADCDCTDNLGLIAYFVNLVKDHPATWGYYLADEVSPQEHERLRTYSDLVKQLDPDHPRLFIVAGSNDPMEIFFRFPSYMKDTTDMMGSDYYPYGYIEKGTALTQYTGRAARTAEDWASQLGLQTAIVLQAFSQVRYARVPLCLPWPGCAPFPSYEQMKAQRDQTLLNASPAIILWWTYQDILQTDDPARHLDDLARAAFAPLPTAEPTPPPPQAACASGWNCMDIGSPALTGSQQMEGAAWTIVGAGWDIWTRMWERADQFHYVWKNTQGNLEISARVASQENTHPSAKAGLMLRQTFDPLSPYYAVYVTPQQRVRVQYRADFLQNSLNLASASGSAPLFLKIKKSGTTYSAYTSPDGASWSLIPNSTLQLVNLDGNLMAGLAVTSHNEAELGTAQFEQVTFSEPRTGVAATSGQSKPKMITMLVLGVAVVGVFLFLALLRNYSDARQRVV
jgi:hypothetical protein